MSELKEDIAKAIRSAGKDWKTAKRKADKQDKVRHSDLSRMRTYRPPRVSIKDYAYEVMDEAFNKASANGRYLANARQIMYAARPLVLELSGGRCWRDSSYFTQTLLKDYIEFRRPSWASKVVWDARGHFAEPHTNRVIGLGGADVGSYAGKWTPSQVIKYGRQKPKAKIETSGPALRFGAVLFIEKEGFAPILEAAGLAKRYDMAIMSSKGIPVGASCQLASKLHRTGVKVLTLHDFDKQGFILVKTLREGARLSPGTPVIDLGFRLEDIEGLPDEPVYYRQREDPRHYLEWECGCTKAEADFLVEGGGYRGWHGRRVELNAMTSDQFIDWLEGKLRDAGVAKLIPDGETLADAFERASFLQAVNEKAREIERKLAGQKIDIPDDLDERIQAKLTESPETSWDEAIWRIAQEQAIWRMAKKWSDGEGEL